jgi:hypothetical protein
MDDILNFPNLSPERQEELLNGPSLPPPDGVTPNLIDPPNWNKEAYTIFSICFLLGASSALGRAYTQTRILRRVRLEDCKWPWN